MNAKPPGGFEPRASRGPPPPPEAPPGLAARVAAAQAIADVLTSFRPLEERFSAVEFEARFAGLEARDRALGAFDRHRRLSSAGNDPQGARPLSAKGLPRRAGALEWTLIVAAAQILFLDVPDHAAVDLAVHATRADPGAAPFAGLVNAVLRNLARAKDEILASGDPLDDDTPQWLAARWRASYGDETAREIAARPSRRADARRHCKA